MNPNDDKNPLRVHFRIRNAAEGEHGNIKAQENADRRFILCKENFIAEVDGEAGTELVIYFEYRPSELNDWNESERVGKKSPPAQKDLLSIAVRQIAQCDIRQVQKWLKSLLAKSPTEKDKERTVLEKHLDRYTKRNTFDYFIHKDLGGFLRRELDFYIKNEVMHLDDVENETAPKVEQYLSKIKAIRKVASKIIDFLAQLENFQKKLWLKKKFVVETNYCITLDRIPEEFYPEIAANEEQRKEWVKLFAIDEIKGDLVTVGYSEPLKIEFLKEYKHLSIDTSNFSATFKDKIVSVIQGLSETTDGLLINSENFHALRVLRNSYKGRIDSIYIDPPYNTDATPIVYKNDYKSSSWLTLIANRIHEADELMQQTDGYAVIAIDDHELTNLSRLLEEQHGKEVYRVIVNHYPGSGTGRSNVSRTHEYALFLVPKNKDLLRGEARPEGWRERGFSRSGTGDNNYRTGRPNSFYAVLVDESKCEIVGFEPPPPRGLSNYPKGKTKENYLRVYPIGDDGSERCWTLSYESAGDYLKQELLKCSSNNIIKRKYFDEGSRNLLPSVWLDKKYSAVSHGTNLLTAMFGDSGLFSYPKSIHTVLSAIEAGLFDTESGIILDYFAGSGTTGHAVIALNRAGGTNHKYILVEVNDYFEQVTKPRVCKAAYCNEWTGGKPKSHNLGVSQTLKYLRLESYEDALNNLESKRTDQTQLTLDSKPAQGDSGFREQYILKYMLDVETKGSQSLLNIQNFKDPTAYKMLIKRPGTDESKLVNVDLIETFNWLIGLTVDHIAAPQTFTASFKRDEEKRLVLGSSLRQANDGKWWFRAVTGKDPEGRNVLVVWRKRPGGDEAEGIEQDNLVLNEWFRKLGFSTKDREFDLIYVNGTNNLENVRTLDENWKVRLIEEDFMHLMFDVDEV